MTVSRQPFVTSITNVQWWIVPLVLVEIAMVMLLIIHACVDSVPLPMVLVVILVQQLIVYPYVFLRYASLMQKIYVPPLSRVIMHPEHATLLWTYVQR